MAARIYILSALVLCAAGASPQQLQAPTPHSVSLLYTVTPEYAPLAWLQGRDRFPRGAKLYVKSLHHETALLPDFFASADADLAFDAASILFAGKRGPSEKWQVWRLQMPHGTPEQLTHCVDDCARPLFLPEDRFVYIERVNGTWQIKVASLQATADAVQLTHGDGNSVPTAILHDGRILFEAGFPFRDSTLSELYTIYTDGSGVEAYRCDHGRNRYSGTQLSSGDVVFSVDGRLARFTSSLAQQVVVAAPAGSYAGDIAESTTGAWLLSWQSTKDKHFSLRTWKPGTSVLAPTVTNTQADVVQPRWLVARGTPNRHPSALHEWAYANTLCLNAYTSKEHFEPGSIASVRMYTRDALGTTQMLGTAPVEKDGSFYLRVPGDKPLQLELLDGSGTTLKKENGWYWLRSGEQRICVGCHAGAEIAPQNTVPAVLLRSTLAADFTQEHPSARPQSSAGGH